MIVADWCQNVHADVATVTVTVDGYLLSIPYQSHLNSQIDYKCYYNYSYYYPHFLDSETPLGD